MSRRRIMNYERAQRRAKLKPVRDVSGPLRTLMSASTFREDPLPDRPMKDRPAVTLPRVKWLERPDP